MCQLAISHIFGGTITRQNPTKAWAASITRYEGPPTAVKLLWGSTGMIQRGPLVGSVDTAVIQQVRVRRPKNNVPRPPPAESLDPGDIAW